MPRSEHMMDKHSILFYGKWMLRTVFPDNCRIACELNFILTGGLTAALNNTDLSGLTKSSRWQDS